MSQRLENPEVWTYFIDESRGLLILRFDSDEDNNYYIRISTLEKGESNFKAMVGAIQHQTSVSPCMLKFWQLVSIARDECIDRGLIQDE